MLVVLMVSDSYTLAAELGNVLLARQWQVTTAESCTGGGVASAITDIPGSSSWFGGGFVTYSNHHKTMMLGVNEDSLCQWGAVSEQVVVEMARGALHYGQADIAVSVSGVAGPDGGSVDKPVGTVWFAWATAERVQTACELFQGNRQQVRQQSVQAALRGLIELAGNTV